MRGCRLRSILATYLWLLGAALGKDVGLGLRKKDLKRPKGGGYYIWIQSDCNYSST